MQKIIKALRICANNSQYCPKECPRHEYKRAGCQERLMKDAANLLEQQFKSKASKGTPKTQFKEEEN